MDCAEGHFPGMPRAFPAVFLTDFQDSKKLCAFFLVLLSCSWCVSGAWVVSAAELMCPCSSQTAAP